MRKLNKNIKFKKAISNKLQTQYCGQTAGCKVEVLKIESANKAGESERRLQTSTAVAVDFEYGVA